MGLSRDRGRCFQVPDRTGPDSDLAEVLGLCPKSNRKELGFLCREGMGSHRLWDWDWDWDQSLLEEI